MTTKRKQSGFQRTLARESYLLIKPIVNAADGGPTGVARLVDDTGISNVLLEEEFEDLVVLIQDDLVDSVEQLVDGISDVIGGEDVEMGDMTVWVEAVEQFITGLETLDEVNFQSADIDDLGLTILDYLLIKYLHDYHRDVHHLLFLTGVIERTGDTSYGRFDYQALPGIFEDPDTKISNTIVDEEGVSYSKLALVVGLLSEVASRQGMATSLSEPHPDHLERLLGVDDILDLPAVDSVGNIAPQATVNVLTLPVGNVLSVLGLRILPLPETDDDGAGFGLVPFVRGILEEGTETSFGKDDDWTFSANISGNASLESHGIAVRGAEGELETSLRGMSDDVPVESNLTAELGVVHDATPDESAYTPVLGADGDSRLDIGEYGAVVQFEYTEDESTIRFLVPIEGRIVVEASDGFLESVLPEDGIEYDFDATLGWSSKSGLYFESGGTLEAAIPQNAQLGPISMEEIYVGALPDGVDDDAEDDPGVTLTASASASVELGPVVGTVQRMGIRATIAFPEDGDGSLGPIDLDVGFDPPNGIGLAIDAEGVSGGGFLELDYENERYAGAVQLHVGELTFNAVGLLTTRMPDGSDGFSLLVLITAEFPPIELGLGFTLNGLGGLVGIHRGVKTDPLKRAVRDGTLDSVLFPEDVVENAPRIVSDLRETFPPTADYHVFGPMARLGWGTPTLITADLGVLVEIPSIRIVLLGRISAVLPDEVAPLVELNAGVFGIIDPAVPELELHASLYDSRVVAWDLSGDFGLRIRGGDQPDFLLSAGGFHPQYDPPASFADMRRLRASLGPPGGNPSLVLKGYFAVTSNTVQAGANCSFAGEFGPASVDGELGFDALVQFDPFEFVVDIIASLSVRALKTTFSVSLEGSLSGPSPWHIDGKVKVSIAFVSATVRVDATFGSADDRDALPPVDVLSKLAAAVEQPGNWQTGLPGDGESPVTLRDPSDVDVEDNGEDETPTILVHPLAAPSVRQTVVPLDFEIERFGNAEPANATRFEIAGASVDGEAENAEPMLEVGEPVTEKFAPGEYLDLSDDERLDSPAFESMQAGTRFESGGVYAGQETADDGPNLANNARRTVLAYETSVRDEACDNYGVALDSFDAVEVVPTSLGSEITRQLTRATIDRQTIGCESGPAPKETVDEGTTPSEATLEGSFTGGTSDRRYRIVRTDTFEPVDLDGHDDGGYTKAEAKRTIERYAPDGATSQYQVVAGDQLE
ncbi:hypothetical protein OB955_04150 [Halobacteria archaeon AArc-m2/3/4]|uniref:DUF6603 domain-containing protein n=1 Tax=Natronoglomus mannanivorans TaxID=2979990 RepID=A0ABT2QAH1_9EURY|nr:hypothetical protein [Halobacteria archaeon AArc-m2/3/4]